ncbi:MAG: hypothetical protein AAFX94_15445, partial [Myxococcota bacterium]
MRALVFIALVAPGLAFAQADGESEFTESGAEDNQDEVRDLIDAMTNRLARERNEEGIQALNASPANLPKALDSFQAAYALDSDDVEIINNLGFTALLGEYIDQVHVRDQSLRGELD